MDKSPKHKIELKEAKYKWLIIYDFLYIEYKKSQDYSMMLEVSNDMLEIVFRGWEGARKGQCGIGSLLFIDLAAGYTGVFSWCKSSELVISSMFVRCQNKGKILQKKWRVQSHTKLWAQISESIIFTQFSN